MERSWTVEDAPPLDVWIDELADRGWQALRHREGIYRAEREIGASRFPVRLATTWRLELVERPTEQLSVTVSVPAFADGVYAEERVRDQVAEIVGAVGAEPPAELAESADLLGHLRRLRETE